MLKDITCKTVTVSYLIPDYVPDNEVKNWVKACPFSPDGGQNLTWDYTPIVRQVEVPDPSPTEEQKDDTDAV